MRQLAATELRLMVFYEAPRWQWRLETLRGNHGVIILSGTAYMTRAAALAGYRRFARAYLREGAPAAPHNSH